jgi:hypothetical protein
MSFPRVKSAGLRGAKVVARRQLELPTLQIGDRVDMSGRIVSKVSIRENKRLYIVAVDYDDGEGKLLVSFSAGHLRKRDDRGTSHQTSAKTLRGRDR